MPKSEDEKRDAVLRRMLKTPPKPHAAEKKTGGHKANARPPKSRKKGN